MFLLDGVDTISENQPVGQISWSNPLGSAQVEAGVAG